MRIETFEKQGRVPVTVLQPHGELDGSNYRDLIDRAQAICDAGAQDILLDLSHVSYTSSSGLVAIHAIALMARGEEPPDPEYGWGAIHAIKRDLDQGVQQHLKLLSPQPQVDKVLRTTGFYLFLEVHSELDAAIASF